MEKSNNFYQNRSGLFLMSLGAVFIVLTFLGYASKSNYLINPLLFILFFIVVGGFSFFYKSSFTKSKSPINKHNPLSLRILIITMILYGLFMCIFPMLYFNLSSVSSYRTYWLICFLVTGLHFIPFSFFGGKQVIILSFFTTSNSLIGLFLYQIPFLYFSILNGSILLIFGIYYSFFKNKKTQNTE